MIDEPVEIPNRPPDRVKIERNYFDEEVRYEYWDVPEKVDLRMTAQPPKFAVHGDLIQENQIERLVTPRYTYGRKIVGPIRWDGDGADYKNKSDEPGNLRRALSGISSSLHAIVAAVKKRSIVDLATSVGTCITALGTTIAAVVGITAKTTAVMSDHEAAVNTEASERGAKP